MFREVQFPCEHAAASIFKVGADPVRFQHTTYLVPNRRTLCNGAVLPVDLTQNLSDIATLVPIINKKAGRPKVTRMRSGGETCSNESVCCTKCGARGHKSAFASAKDPIN
jgi:hypothetical protein